MKVRKKRKGKQVASKQASGDCCTWRILHACGSYHKGSVLHPLEAMCAQDQGFDRCTVMELRE